MSAPSRAAAALVAGLIAGAGWSGAGGAASAGAVTVDVASYGVWTTEVVSRADVGRVACAAFTGAEGGPGVFVALASAGAPGEVSALVFRERAERAEETKIGGEGYGERSGVAVVFSNGDVFLAKDSVRGADELGAFAEAYPNPDAAPEIIDALRASRQVKLMRGDATLHDLPLDGFADAFAAIAAACAYEFRVAG